jgi:outer membrane biosynthesis protein TonB
MPLFEIPTETPTEPTPLPPVDPQQPVRIVVGRHGELDTHELIRLLDSIEDERGRSRFRESLYISMFVWVAITWFFLYGLGMLWHPPKLKTVADVHDHQLTDLELPTTHVPAPVIKSAPPAPRPTIDTATMEKLRAMERDRQPTPAPVSPTPQPAAPPPPPVAAVTQPRLPQPVVDAPTAQPNFNRPSSSGNAIQDALHAAARDRSSGDLGGGRAPRRSGPLNLGGAEVLSDTQGVDFGPYLRRILSDIKRNWDPLIPAEAESPLYKQGESYIRFSINPDGTIAAMHLDDSTHDEAINRSCWGSITSEGQFPPLPKEFRGPNLELRIHYLVNKQPIE